MQGGTLERVELEEGILEGHPGCEVTIEPEPVAQCPEPASWRARVPCGDSFLACARHHDAWVSYPNQRGSYQCVCGSRHQLRDASWGMI